jgi:hypothetical protein
MIPRWTEGTRRQSARVALGEWLTALTDRVIGGGSKALLFAATHLEEALGGSRALGLQPLTQPALPVPQPVDVPAGVHVAIGVGGDILDPQVNA